LDVRHCFKTLSLQFHFQFGKQIQLSSPVVILEIKAGSSLPFSCSSRHTFTHRFFRSIVKRRGTNFIPMWRMFKFSVKISWQTP
jgi:hypothetical protein